MQKLDLPSGDYNSVVTGDYADFHIAFADANGKINKALLRYYGELRRRSLHEMVAHWAYASVAFSAFGMMSAAQQDKMELDPVAFGKRCEEIAREQQQRYRAAYEKPAGTA
jgi:hypothetical protein